MRVAPAILLLGCSRAVPSLEAPIRGGTAEQLAEIERVLADFEEATGGGRVELKGIRLTSPKPGAHYNPITRRIVVGAAIPVREIPNTLRHELCHALDLQQDLLDGRDNPIDDWVHLLDQTDGVVEGSLIVRRRKRSEAFAMWCAHGPLHASLLAERCPEERRGVTEVAQWLMDEVWTAYEPPPLLPEPPATASWRPVFEPGQVTATATREPSVIELEAARRVTPGQDVFEYQWTTVDVYSGMRVSTDAELVRTSYGDFPADLDGVWRWEEAALDSGPAAAVAGLDLFTRGASTSRALYWDGQTLFNAGCGLSSGDVVAAADQLWKVWLEGATVYWAPLGPSFPQ